MCVLNICLHWWILAGGTISSMQTGHSGTFRMRAGVCTGGAGRTAVVTDPPTEMGRAVATEFLDWLLGSLVVVLATVAPRESATVRPAITEMSSVLPPSVEPD